MTDEIERAAKSKQPRFSGKEEAVNYWLANITKWCKEALITVPPYQPDSRELDTWLRTFWKQEPLLSGVISSVVSIDKNRGWTLTGGRNQVNRFSKVLREAEDGQGWRKFCDLQSQGFWTSNMGAVAELGRAGRNGPLTALWNVDPTRCRLTGDSKLPLEYYPNRGKRQKWRAGDFFRSNSLTSNDESLYGLGYCAEMRAVQLAIIMASVYRHDQEMLFSAMQKGLLFIQGVDKEQWVDAMETHAERMSQKEREFFGGLSIFFSNTDMDAKLVSLSQLPDNFDLGEFSEVLIMGYALCFGYDPREFWAISQGALGTGRETEVQAIKATDKGGLDFSLAFQDGLQLQLPVTVLFEFEVRNEAGQQLEAEVIKTFAEAVNAMSESPIQDDQTLTKQQRLFMYASRGFIPDEWTEVEEAEIVSDTDTVRERLLEREDIRRACELYQDEPIVRYEWPLDITRELWRSGAEALHRRSYPVKKNFIQRQIEPLETGVEAEDEQLEEFAALLIALTLQAQEGAITQAEFEEELNALIERFGASMFVAASELAFDNLTDEQLGYIDEYIETNQDSIPGLATDIYDGRYVDNEEGLESRLFLWLNTLVLLGVIARLSGHPNQNYVFILGGTINHCDDCLRLNGHVHSGEAWLASGMMPQSHNLECNGFRCECRLDETGADERGNF